MNPLAKKVLSDHWDKELPVKLAPILSKLNIELGSGTNSDVGEYLDKQILLPASHPIYRGRFVMAHMLGHLLLGHPPGKETLLNFHIKVEDGPEREANEFARDLLLPTEAVQWAVTVRRFQTIKEMGDFFQVSGMLMQYKMESLNYLQG